MHLSVAQELSILKPGDQTQYTFLFREFEIGLKTHEIVKTAGEIILAELYDGIGAAAGMRISKSDRTHRSKSQRIDAVKFGPSRTAGIAP